MACSEALVGDPGRLFKVSSMTGWPLLRLRRRTTKATTTARMINATPPPTALPTMIPKRPFKLLGLTPVRVGDGAELDVNMDEVLLLPTLVGLGVASGSRPTAIATASLYVWFGRVVTSMNAHRGIAVPGEMS